MRSLATRAISEGVGRGASLANAVKDVLDRLGRDYDADVGLIAVDSAGNPVALHRTRDMPHAFFHAGGPVVSRMRV
jgi:isoaspartyl peptidase/L-asparaginase-like protein (Ntn-hydrolase superfamily)